jgi:hypothetical protein
MQKDKATIKEHAKRVEDNFVLWNNFWRKIGKLEKSAPEDSLFRLLAVLFLTEGLLAFIVDTIIYNLMLKEHHDIWSERKREFVSSFNELLELHDLDEKLKFLDEHGFGFISNQIYPGKMRNAIAHLDFDIEPDTGTVYIKGKRLQRRK